MFHKIKDAHALSDLRLSVQFASGATKVYDVAPLLDRFEAFKPLQDHVPFSSVEVDAGGCGVVWNDEIDLSCEELWAHGVEAEDTV